MRPWRSGGTAGPRRRTPTSSTSTRRPPAGSTRRTSAGPCGHSRSSSFRTDWEAYDSIYALDVTYLEPPTSELRAAIDRRTAAMLADGLVEEAAELRDAHPLGLSDTARQAIGYAEAFAHLDGDLPADDLHDAIATRTWQYARRQRSWFRRDPRCVPSRP